MVKLTSEEIGGEIDIADLDKVLVIVAYDLPSEGKKCIILDEHNFLQTTRANFRNNLYDLKCSPIQQSLFRVPKKIPHELQLRYPNITEAWLIEEVKRRVAEFKQTYSDGWLNKDTGVRKSYASRTRMEVLPVAMTAQGYDVFVGMQLDGLYAWIGSKLEVFERWMERGEILNDTIKLFKRDMNSIEDSITVFFGPGSEDFEQTRYDNLKFDFEALHNTFQELLDTIKVVKKLSKKADK
jgi:hypothetical protein